MRKGTAVLTPRRVLGAAVAGALSTLSLQASLRLRNRRIDEFGATFDAAYDRAAERACENWEILERLFLYDLDGPIMLNDVERLAQVRANY